MAKSQQPPKATLAGVFKIDTPDLAAVVVPDALGTILVQVRDLAGNDRYLATISEIGSAPGVFISTGPLGRLGTTNLYSARLNVGPVPAAKPANNNKTVTAQGFMGSIPQGTLSNDFIAWGGGSGSGSFLASKQPGEQSATGGPTPVALLLQFGPSARAGSERLDQPTTLVYSRGPHFAGCWFSAPSPSAPTAPRPSGCCKRATAPPGPSSCAAGGSRSSATASPARATTIPRSRSRSSSTPGPAKARTGPRPPPSPLPREPTMIPLPVCRWRGERRQDRYVCQSVKFLDPPNLVRAELCAGCFFVDHAPPPPLPPALPCVHLGGAAASAGVFSCAQHGLCAPARCDDVPGARCCARCPDYLARDPFGPGSAEMRHRAEDHLAGLEDYPEGRYRGRGIVLAGGGRYFPSLYVTVRDLRHFGSRLPIQVWHLGPRELPAPWQALLAPYGVECVDAETVRQGRPARRLGGWELKVFATLHCPFEEVLFLDADCYPCRPPDFLFDLEDYRAAGAIFWSDVATTDIRLRWAAFGVAGPRRPGSVESGQYVVNKRLCWRPLNLAWFYNDHSDYYYHYGYGDKHTFEVAWARCGPPFVMWQPRATWAEVAYLHAGPDGLPLFVHRCADKFRWTAGPFSTPQVYSGPAFCAHLPLEREYWGWLANLTTAAGPGSRGGSALVPEKVVRIGLPGHFNCSLVQHQGRLLLASRDRETGARVALSELGPDYQPRWTRLLPIVHPRASAACEGPRLFFFGGRLHCAFIGVEHDGRDWHVHQMVCRLDDDGEVEEVWLPDYAARTVQEKNWQFFEHDGELYSVYTVSPHVVLRHRGGRAEKVAHTAARLAWPGCHLRGGAPPVRLGDERYHFFHCVKERDGHKEYSAGVSTFAARPPFEVRRAAETPILLPDEHDRPPGLPVSVVFPCGAFLRDGRWIISYGYQDRECRIAVFAADEIEKRLRPV